MSSFSARGPRRPNRQLLREYNSRFVNRPRIEICINGVCPGCEYRRDEQQRTVGMVRGAGPGDLSQRLRSFLQGRQPEKIVAPAYGLRMRFAVPVRVSSVRETVHAPVQHENARGCRTQKVYPRITITKYKKKNLQKSSCKTCTYVCRTKIKKNQKTRGVQLYIPDIFTNFLLFFYDYYSFVLHVCNFTFI